MKNIEISNLSKRYKNGVLALDHISFAVGGGVFGLLGHNGAGKTTLMKALVTVLKPLLEPFASADMTRQNRAERSDAV